MTASVRPLSAARLGVAAALTTFVIAAGCGDSGEPTSMDASGADGVAGTVTVLAAASLTESFEVIADRIEAAHPDLDVVLSFGPSSGLVEQVLAGAPADVLATADGRTMQLAVDGGALDGEPTVFAGNTLTLVVPAGNPGSVSGVADLARPELRVAVCEAQVPCGAAAEELMSLAGVAAAPDTYTTDVKEATALVSLGEVDTALVYRTDALAAGDAVETVDVAESADIVNDYPVAIVAGAANPGAAEVVVDALLDENGQQVLGDAGFLPAEHR